MASRHIIGLRVSRLEVWEHLWGLGSLWLRVSRVLILNP